MNHYQTLGLAPTADLAEIKAAHRRLVRLYHPDAGGDATIFKAIQVASEVLSDPEKRCAYDDGLRNRPVESLPAIAREAVSDYFTQC